MQWVIRQSDNVFLRDAGTDGVGAGEASVTIPRVPPMRFERYNGAGGIRSATAQEIADFDTARKDYEADFGSMDPRLAIRALAQLDYEERQKLQVQVGQTLRTVPQCLARFKAIYLGLLP